MQALLEAVKPGDPDWELVRAIDPGRLPSHIAVIMDGNGRWAQQRSLPRVAGHNAGIDPVRATVECCARLGVKALTLYAFSLENWKRPRSEVEALWRLMRKYIHRELPKLVEHNIRIQVLGRWRSLPESVQEDLRVALEACEGNTGMSLNLALNYGGRAELVDAVNRIIEQSRRAGTLEGLYADEESISAALDTAGLPDPDLLIRTSGEMRISNFLLWQIAYAELYVTETLWPDFRQRDLLRAIIEYQKRVRRFGGLAGTPVAEEQLVGALDGGE